MKKFLALFFLSAALLTPGCAWRLAQNDSPFDRERSTLEGVLASGEGMNVGGAPMEFDDRRIAAKFEFWKKQFSLTLTNRSKTPIRLLWEEATFIDADEHSHRVLHRGERIQEKQPPTLLGPGATLVDFVSQEDAEYLVSALAPTRKRAVSRIYSGPIDKPPTSEEGVQVAFYLPIAVNGTTEPYVFKFFLVKEN
ncbi:MAG TPA: hypothetical protein DD435_05425 [Cyanobacteria bacterium UBA8530]|nr:hypothetical protein [Cyanobacteria bacterium UBA8530]